MYVDVHCHLTQDSCSPQIDEVIKRASDAGLKAIVVSGVNPVDNCKVMELSSRYEIVKASLGIYPIDALGLAPDVPGGHVHPGKIDLDEQFAYFQKYKKRITAIGECGLDYKYGKDHKEEQQKIFVRILEFMKNYDKPLVLHTRKAELDTIDIVEGSRIDCKRVILHCFEGNKQLVKRAGALGMNFSIPSNLCRSSHFQMMVDVLPLNQLFTETDSPYLGAITGKPSEPADVVDTVRIIAERKNMEESECAQALYMNYRRVFG